MPHHLHLGVCEWRSLPLTLPYHSSTHATTRGVRTQHPLRLPSASTLPNLGPQRCRPPAGRRARERRLAGNYGHGASLCIIPLPNSFPQTTPLRSREGRRAAQHTAARRPPSLREGAADMDPVPRGSPTRQTPPTPPPRRVAGAPAHVQLLKMASVCCGVCRECGRRSQTYSCAASAEAAASTESTETVASPPKPSPAVVVVAELRRLIVGTRRLPRLAMLAERRLMLATLPDRAGVAPRSFARSASDTCGTKRPGW